MNVKWRGAVTAIGCFFAANVFGELSFPQLVPNGRVHECNLCHLDPHSSHGLKDRNIFGDQFNRAGLEWTPALAALDADGDGRTNGEELGDPDGLWHNSDKWGINPGSSTQPGIPDFVTPRIVTTPVTSAQVGQPYEYQVTASIPSPSGGQVVYSLPSFGVASPAPEGMGITPLKGLLTWSPALSDLGAHTVVVEAWGEGQTDRQTFLLTVADPTQIPPTITSVPPPLAFVGTTEPYEYQITAEGADLNYAFHVMPSTGKIAAPDGMTVDSSNGLVRWDVPLSAAGVQDIGIEVSGAGGTAMQHYALHIASEDQGPKWEQVGDLPVENYAAIDFPSGGTEGWISGAGVSLFHTTDGGQNWEKYVDNMLYHQEHHNWLYDVSFSNDMQIGIAVGMKGLIMRTHDGGVSWQRPTTRPDLDFGTPVINDSGQVIGEITARHSERHGGVYLSVEFVTDTDILAARTAGLIDYSDNGGETWHPVEIDHDGYPDVNGLSIDPVTGKAWAVGGRGLINFSSDMGRTWTRQVAGTARSLLDVDMVNDRVGWIVGEGGRILHTVDGGATWERQESSLKYPLYSVSAVDSLWAWATGGRGTILRTANGGRTWEVQPSTPDGSQSLQDFLEINMINERYGRLVGTSGTVLLYTDFSDHTALSVATNPNSALPEFLGVAVLGASPNPFNPRTQLRLRLPEHVESDAFLRITNVLGQTVRCIQLAGSGEMTVQWDGTNSDGQPASSGVYFYTVIADNLSATGRVTLVR